MMAQSCSMGMWVLSATSSEILFGSMGVKSSVFFIPFDLHREENLLYKIELVLYDFP